MKNSKPQYGPDSVVFSLIGKFGYSLFFADQGFVDGDHLPSSLLAKGLCLLE